MLLRLYRGLVVLRYRLCPRVPLWLICLVNMLLWPTTGLPLCRLCLLVVIRLVRCLVRKRRIVGRWFSLIGVTRRCLWRCAVLTCLLLVRVLYLRRLILGPWRLLLVRRLVCLLSLVRTLVVRPVYVGRSWCRLLVALRLRLLAPRRRPSIPVLQYGNVMRSKTRGR